LTSLARLVLDKGLGGKVGTVRPHMSVHVSWTELEDLWRRTQPSPETDRSAEPSSGPESARSAEPSSAPESARSAEPSPAPGAGRLEPGSTGVPAPVDLFRLVTSPPAEWEDGSGPIPSDVLRRIAEDCEVARVVFGPDSQVIDVGRVQRTFVGHLRRAVVAREIGRAHV